MTTKPEKDLLKVTTESPAQQTNETSVAEDPTVSIPEKVDLAPMVFISYSHDTKEHKAWVAAFAQRLVLNGVEVLFDQWDLGPGDDVPKFMEKAVSQADRVLMICTDPMSVKLMMEREVSVTKR
ncbi:MAG: toll/interleukin-1 receptor domain-containing protein [Verrucomicrobiales bacterium]